MLKVDLSDLWPTAFSIEDIFLMEKTGGKQLRGVFREGVWTAFGSHWDFHFFFALYLHKPLQRALVGENGMRGWPSGLAQKGGAGGSVYL